MYHNYSDCQSINELSSESKLKSEPVALNMALRCWLLSLLEMLLASSLSLPVLLLLLLSVSVTIIGPGELGDSSWSPKKYWQISYFFTLYTWLKFKVWASDIIKLIDLLTFNPISTIIQIAGASFILNRHLPFPLIN